MSIESEDDVDVSSSSEGAEIDIIGAPVTSESITVEVKKLED